MDSLARPASHHPQLAGAERQSGQTESRTESSRQTDAKEEREREVHGGDNHLEDNAGPVDVACDKLS